MIYHGKIDFYVVKIIKNVTIPQICFNTPPKNNNGSSQKIRAFIVVIKISYKKSIFVQYMVKSWKMTIFNEQYAPNPWIKAQIFT